jgi:hypothetical protein
MKYKVTSLQFTGSSVITDQFIIDEFITSSVHRSAFIVPRSSFDSRLYGLKRRS